MVLPKRLIPPVQEFYPLEVSKTTAPDGVCQETTQHAMAGLLWQLQHLSEYAVGMFKNLIEESSKTADNLATLSARASHVQAYLPHLEKMYQETPLDVFHSHQRAKYEAPQPSQKQHLQPDSMPYELKIIYNEECSSPPKLEVFDEYFPKKTKALQLYTNPEFFIEEWIQEQMKLQAAAKAERKAKRAQRKKQQKDVPEVVVKKKPTKLERVRYDPITGQKITTKIQASSAKTAPAASAAPQRLNVKVESRRVPVAQPKAVEPTVRVPTVESAGNDVSPSPRPVVEQTPPPEPATSSPHEESHHHHHHHKKEKHKKHSSSASGSLSESKEQPAPTPAPPVVAEESKKERKLREKREKEEAKAAEKQAKLDAKQAAKDAKNAPKVPQTAPPKAPSTRPPASPRVPESPPPSNMPSHAPPTPAVAPVASAPVAPPPMPAMAAPPPMPKTKIAAATPALKPPGGAPGGLLGQIAAGKTLKKVDVESIPKATDGRSGLLSQIQSGVALKKAAERKLAEKKADDGPISVADILARRIAIIGNDKNDDDSSDSGDDWDDDDWD